MTVGKLLCEVVFICYLDVVVVCWCEVVWCFGVRERLNATIKATGQGRREDPTGSPEPDATIGILLEINHPTNTHKQQHAHERRHARGMHLGEASEASRPAH